MCLYVPPLLQPVEATDDAFWDQFWNDSSTSVQDIFALVPSAEIRAVREESPSNLATLCYKVSSCMRKCHWTFAHSHHSAAFGLRTRAASASILETGADKGMLLFIDPTL